MLCCVGPERSWSVLSSFIATAKGRLVSSMYEFHAKHIADAIEDRLRSGVDMVLVMDNATRVTKEGVKTGDFNRKSVFPRWANQFAFDRIYVPEGMHGLVANSYHIKVTVRDDNRFWLSSGNWKNSSQPNIAPADLNNPAKIKAKDGNREWHVVIKNKTLAGRYRKHILADLDFSKRNGGREEAVAEDVFVDVPIAIEEAVELEAATTRILEPLEINRRVKVKPLLTPDQEGKIYSEAVLELIEWADEQLLFQIPYIDSYKDTARGCRDAGQGADQAVEADPRCPHHSALRSWGLDPLRRGPQKARAQSEQMLQASARHPTKGMIVDGHRVLVGSHNWSGGGVTLNRDASLLFDDPEIAEVLPRRFRDRLGPRITGEHSRGCDHRSTAPRLCG